MQNIRIQTARLELIAADAALVRAEIEDRATFAARLDAAVSEDWPPPFNSVETMAYSMNKLEAHPEQVGWACWYFVLREPIESPRLENDSSDAPRQVIGTGGFHGPPDAEGDVEIGYSILKTFHGRGLGTEVVEALTHWAFAQGVHSVSAQTLPTLHASIRVLEKNGFTFMGEGTEEGAILYRKNRF